jgi:hypothetical protein
VRGGKLAGASSGLDNNRDFKSIAYSSTSRILGRRNTKKREHVLPGESGPTGGSVDTNGDLIRIMTTQPGINVGYAIAVHLYIAEKDDFDVATEDHGFHLRYRNDLTWYIVLTLSSSSLVVVRTARSKRVRPSERAMLTCGIPHRTYMRSSRSEHHRKRVGYGRVQLGLYKIGYLDRHKEVLIIQKTQMSDMDIIIDTDVDRADPTPSEVEYEGVCAAIEVVSRWRSNLIETFPRQADFSEPLAQSSHP